MKIIITILTLLFINCATDKENTSMKLTYTITGDVSNKAIYFYGANKTHTLTNMNDTFITNIENFENLQASIGVSNTTNANIIIKINDNQKETESYYTNDWTYSVYYSPLMYDRQ